jgi:DNA-binding transcriptional MerR regulator
MMNRYLTTSDVARAIGASVDSVRRYERAGLIKAAAKVGHGGRLERLFVREEVERFKAQRKVMVNDEKK